MKVFKYAIATIAVIIAGILAVFIIRGRVSSASGGAVTANCFSLVKQDITEDINISGSLIGDEITVANTQNTKCVELKVAIGDYVNKGDVLFSFDDSELSKSLEQLIKSDSIELDKNENTHQINLRNLKDAKDEKEVLLEQEQQKIDAAKAARDAAYEKLEELRAKCSELEDEQDSDEAAAACKAAYSELSALESEISEYKNAVSLAEDSYENVRRKCDALIQSAQDAIDAEKYTVSSGNQSKTDSLRAQIADCTVTAPVSGIVTELYVSKGVIPREENLITITDISDCRIYACVFESNISKLETGMKASLKTVSSNDQRYEGEIVSISRIPEQNNLGDGKYYGVEIAFTENDIPKDVFLGMTATGHIRLNETYDVFAVPYDAVISDGSQSYIMAAEPSSGGTYRVKKLAVETGMESNYYVEVNGSELQENMIVISAPQDVEENMTIAVNLES